MRAWPGARSHGQTPTQLVPARFAGSSGPGPANPSQKSWRESRQSHPDRPGFRNQHTLSEESEKLGRMEVSGRTGYKIGYNIHIRQTLDKGARTMATQSTESSCDFVEFPNAGAKLYFLVHGASGLNQIFGRHTCSRVVISVGSCWVSTFEFSPLV